MATYGGVKLVAGNLSIPQKNGDAESWKVSQLLGPRTHGTQTTFAPKNYAGLALDASYNLLIHNKIYISQTDFEYDMITEEAEEIITIWNADQISHILYSVSISGSTEGISINIAAPKIFTAETIYRFVLAVFSDGPALQDNTITLVFDCATIVISVYGVRVRPFPFDGNMSALKVSYTIKSAIFENEHFSEQRRALHSKVIRGQDISFLMDEIFGKRFLDFAKKVRNKVLGIPIYSEPINQLQDDLFGLANFSVEENLSDYWNLSNCIYIVLIDLERNVGELKEILSYSSSSLTLKYSVSGHFYKDTTMIYPVMVGIIDERPTIEAITNSIVSTSLKFREVSL